MGKLIALLLAAIALVLAIKFIFLNFPFGTGAGGGGTDDGSAVSVDIPLDPDSSDETNISEIRIEENDIYFDNELCADENELKQKITDIGASREYTFVYDNALKSTYDKVNSVLSELETTLDITIDRK